MNFKEYIERAKETESVDFELIRSRLGNDGLLRMLHAGLGMVTEATELFTAREKRDVVNIKEEFGDLFWYFAIALDSSKSVIGDKVIIDFDSIEAEKIYSVGSYIYELELVLLKNISDYVDSVKRMIYYDRCCINPEYIRDVLEMIYLSAICLMKVYLGNGNCSRILQDNLIKLEKRYGKNFSEEGALNRDVENELNHIEG